MLEVQVEEGAGGDTIYLRGMRDDDIPFLRSLLEDRPNVRYYQLVCSQLTPLGSTTLAMMFSQTVTRAEQVRAARARRLAENAG